MTEKQDGWFIDKMKKCLNGMEGEVSYPRKVEGIDKIYNRMTGAINRISAELLAGENPNQASIENLICHCAEIAAFALWTAKIAKKHLPVASNAETV